MWEYRVRGNSLLESAAVERAVYGRLGPGRSMDDIEGARAALEDAYRAAGYPTVLVNVPEQEVANGIVQLDVSEGRVDRLLVTGSRYFSNGWIREQIPELQPGSVPKLSAFQTQLRTLNLRSADRAVTPVLRPGRTPGTVEAELKVADELPLHASAEVNNQNSADTSDTRLSLSAGYGNLWQREHSLNLTYQVSPEDSDETSTWVASYLWKPARSDKSVAIYAVDNDSDIATVADLSVIGQGQLVGANLYWPLTATDKLSHNLVFGTAWKDFTDTIQLDAPDDDEEDGVVDETPIDYINWSVGYTGSLAADKRGHSFSLTANFGIRDVGNDANELVEIPCPPDVTGICTAEEGEFDNKRQGADPNYFYLNGRYEVSQAIPWSTTLYWNLSAQLAAQPLVSNEQFGAGGMDSVRGYYEAEVLGDRGVQSTLEWQGPNWGPKIWEPLQLTQALLFVDYARLSLVDEQPDQEGNFTLASAGLGVRLSSQRFSGALDWAWPFRDGTSTESGDDRVLFKVRYGF